MNIKDNKNVKASKKTIEIDLNLSKTVITIIVISVLIVIITGVKVVTTVIEAKKSKVLTFTEKEQTTVTWVDSTENDAEGNAKQVPVPKGYTASQIDGETTVSGGFVIYEGDIDWSKIIIESTESEETNTTQAES